MLAVTAEAVATPLVLVTAVVVAMPLANMPLAPLAGAVKVTVAFGTKFRETSSTTARSAVANGVETLADWPPPPAATIEAGALVVLVRLKGAGAVTPGTEAVTL